MILKRIWKFPQYKGISTDIFSHRQISTKNNFYFIFYVILKLSRLCFVNVNMDEFSFIALSLPLKYINLGVD